MIQSHLFRGIVSFLTAQQQMLLSCWFQGRLLSFSGGFLFIHHLGFAQSYQGWNMEPLPWRFTLRPWDDNLMQICFGRKCVKKNKHGANKKKKKRQKLRYGKKFWSEFAKLAANCNFKFMDFLLVAIYGLSPTCDFQDAKSAWDF